MVSPQCLSFAGLSHRPTSRGTDLRPNQYISGVAVQSLEQANTEKVRLELNGVDPNVFRFVVAPHLFDKHELSAMIQSGNRLTETPV